MRPATAHLHYNFGGQQEYCLSFGDAAAARTILIIPPLFDEMNRVRHMLVEAMRALAEGGIRSCLPDLPGCNESAAEFTAQSIATWQDAMMSAATQLGATHIASIRGGSLIDDGAALPVWRLAPVKGSSLLKKMFRTRIASAKEDGRAVTAEQLVALAQSGPVELSGNMLGLSMLDSLGGAEPKAVADLREITLAEIAGTPLWLRAEPQHDAAMSAALAAELDRWSASCGG